VSEVIAIAGLTRTDAAMRAMTKAADRLRQLEVEEQAAFSEYAAAQSACRREGLACDLTLNAGMAASYAEWKQRQALAEVQE
jgi:hypothetical protein